MKTTARTTTMPARDSVNLLDHYQISAEDLAAFQIQDEQRRAERKRDRRARRLAREQAEGQPHF